MTKHKSTIHDIATRIQAAFDPHGGVESPRIVVHLDGTRAILIGDVNSWVEHEAAERAALSVPGVTSVDNRLALRVTCRPSSDAVVSPTGDSATAAPG